MKIDLGQAIAILANIGVIAGIVFLAAELQQNNELMEAEARAARRAELETTLAAWEASSEARAADFAESLKQTEADASAKLAAADDVHQALAALPRAAKRQLELYDTHGAARLLSEYVRLFDELSPGDSNLELELKLAGCANTLETLWASTIARRNGAKSRHLISTYFDTSDQRLRRRGAVRCRGRQRCGGGCAGLGMCAG